MVCKVLTGSLLPEKKGWAGFAAVAKTSRVIGFFKPGASHPVSPRCFQRLGHFAPQSFTAFGGQTRPRQASPPEAGKSKPPAVRVVVDSASILIF